MTPRLLIADDDGIYLARFLETKGHLFGDGAIDTAETPEMVRWCIGNSHYDVIVLDIRFSKNPSDRQGLTLIPEIRAKQPSAYLLVVTGLEDDEVLAKCRALGAQNYVVKGDHTHEMILAKIGQALKRQVADRDWFQEGTKLAKRFGAVFVSEAMGQVYAQAARARADKKRSCFILGPTGVGKESVAAVIGKGIANAPYVAVNCAAIPDTLIEGELFGHVRGSFTGAVADKEGKFDQADGGTLFLDEIAELTPKAQATLLRVLQDGVFQRTGGNKDIRVNVRVIGATKEELPKLVQEGRFREDLYRRLEKDVIRIPSLKERPEDIEPIIEYLIETSEKPDLTLDPLLMRFLKRYPWPRNVGELKFTIEKMIADAVGSELDAADVPAEFAKKAGLLAADGRKTPAEVSLSRVFLELPFGLTPDEVEKKAVTEYIGAICRRFPGKVTSRALAEAMNIPKTNLLRRLSKYDLSMADFSGSEKEDICEPEHLS